MATALAPPCDESVGAHDKSGACANQRGTLIAAILGSSLAFVVGSIINVALPAMQLAFETNSAGAQWIVNAYLLPVGAFVLMGGALGDHYGRKRIFLGGLILFTVATLICAAAPSLELLFAARALQGVGAALLAPNSLAIIADGFSGEARGKAVGAWAAAGAIAGAAAPVIGGWLVDVASWRWAFFIVLPPAIGAFWVGTVAIEESREDKTERAPLDWLGAAAVTFSLIALIWALTAFPQKGVFAPSVMAAFAAGLMLAALFLILEYRKRNRAMMPLSLFANMSFSGISLLTFLLYTALGGLIVLLPYMLIQSFGFSATAAGAAILPFPLIMGLLSRRAGGLSETVGVKRMLTFGPLCVAAGFILFARTPFDSFSYWTDILPALMIMATGMAASVAPLTAAVMNTVDDDHVGVASGVNNAISRTAGLVATALLGLVLINAASGPQELVAGFRNAAIVGAILAALSGAVAFFMIGGNELGSAGSATST
ncbi:MAG: MFS transporter [Pseudomonadota bacterium]